MTDSNIKHLELLGKQVSFVAVSKYGNTFHEGRVTNIVFSLNGCPEISLDDENFYFLSEIIEFQVLDSDPVGDAFEALITDNKAFIDSLSKPTL